MNKLLYIITVVISQMATLSHAQQYNAPNIHYYAVAEDSVQMPDSCSACDPLHLEMVIIRDDNIYTCSMKLHPEMKRCMSTLQEGIRNAFYAGTIDYGASTSRYDIYRNDVRTNIFGCPNSYYHALSKDLKRYIIWNENEGTSKRNVYYKVDIEDILSLCPEENENFLE